MYTYFADFNIREVLLANVFFAFDLLGLETARNTFGPLF